jgi:hypothetical protein
MILNGITITTEGVNNTLKQRIIIAFRLIFKKSVGIQYSTVVTNQIWEHLKNKVAHSDSGTINGVKSDGWIDSESLLPKSNA